MRAVQWARLSGATYVWLDMGELSNKQKNWANDRFLSLRWTELMIGF